MFHSKQQRGSGGWAGPQLEFWCWGVWGWIPALSLPMPGDPGLDSGSVSPGAGGPGQGAGGMLPSGGTGSQQQPAPSQLHPGHASLPTAP